MRKGRVEGAIRERSARRRNLTSTPNSTQRRSPKIFTKASIIEVITTRSRRSFRACSGVVRQTLNERASPRERALWFVSSVVREKQKMASLFRSDILKGKVALITGGGSGIGYEIAAQFGQHGASVAIMGRRNQVLHSAVSALRSLGISAFGFEGDVRKQEDASRVVESTFNSLGSLDILVNAAAGNFLVSAEDLSPNGFRTVMDIDSVGTFTMCREALKYLKKGGPGRNSSRGGTIINISATLHYTAVWYQIHVSAAKAAVDAITRNLALEWGADYDIRVNGIAPGPIEGTPGLRKLAPEEISSRIREDMPLYKVGEKWDIAMAALYLASEAGKYVNGTTVIADGGMWLSSPRRLPKEAVKQLSRVVEKRSRDSTVGVPKSKL